jgi:hypothetical protein
MIKIPSMYILASLQPVAKKRVTASQIPVEKRNRHKKYAHERPLSKTDGR